MPAACIHPTIVPDAHRGVARLGDVLEQANRVRSVPNHPGRYAGFPERATSVRPLLQLLQSLGLDGPRPGPPVGRGDRRPAQSARLVVPGRRRHLAAQTRQACLRFGLVPRCRGLDGQTGRDRQRQSLGGDRIGDLHSRNQQDLLPADPRHAASCGQEPQERSHVGQGNAPGHPGMVSRSKAGFHRRRGLFGEQSARPISTRG